MKYVRLFEEQSAYNIYDIIAMQKETAEEVLLQDVNPKINLRDEIL